MTECEIFNSKIHIEVPVLLLFFVFTLSDSIGTNLIIYRTCYVTLGYNKTECALLGTENANNNTAHLESLVQPYASVVKMVSTLITACISAVLCLFVGPWSDRFGRKPVLVIPILGFVFSFFLIAIFAALEYTSPWFLVLCMIPVVLTGGGASYFTVLLCYITDVTNESNRGMKMGVFATALSLGIFLGNISSSYVLAATNYPIVFVIAAVSCLLALIFTIFFIPESLTNRETEGRLEGLFQFVHVKHLFQAALKKRDNYDRFIVLTCILITTIATMIISGDGAVGFLFLREKFQWTLEHFTLFGAAQNIAGVLGTVIGIYVLHKLMKLPETLMLIIGFASTLFGTLMMAFANYDWEVYTAASIRSVSGVVTPMLRSLISKIVPGEDVGKVFSLIVISESFFGMCGNPLYTAIYNSTILINSSIFNFVSAGICVLSIILVIGVIFARGVPTNIPFQQIVNEDNEDSHVGDETSA